MKKFHVPIVSETPEHSRSKRLSTIQSSAATLSLAHQQTRFVSDTPQASTTSTQSFNNVVQTVQDTPDEHTMYIEKKLKYSRRKDISPNIPSEATFVQQSQGALSSTIVESSPLLTKKPRDFMSSNRGYDLSKHGDKKSSVDGNSTVQLVPISKSDANTVSEKSTIFETTCITPTTPINTDANTSTSSSSSRRKKGKPCKIVAWDKLESVEPIASSVFRSTLNTDLSDNRNVINQAPTINLETSVYPTTQPTVQLENNDKKPKRRESTSRNKRLSNVGTENFVNFLLAKEKTPSPATKLLKEKIAAKIAEEDSDEDAEIGNKSAKCDTANKPQTEKDDHVNESSRKSIFISGNVKSRTKQQLQSGGGGGNSNQSSDYVVVTEPTDSGGKNPRSRKNLCKELGSSDVSASSSLLAVPLLSSTKRGRRSNIVAEKSIPINNSKTNASGVTESTISVSGISGLSFQNFSSESAKAAINIIEKDGWNSDVEKQLTAEKSKKKDVEPSKSDKNVKQVGKCVNPKPASTRKSLKRKPSGDGMNGTGKKTRLEDVKDKIEVEDMAISETPVMVRKPALKVRNEQKTSFTPEPMDLCDTPARRSGRKSTQASTLATIGLLKSPSLLKESKLVNSDQESKEQELPHKSNKSAQKTANVKEPSSKKKNEPKKDKANQELEKANDDIQDDEDIEDLPCTQAVPLFDNLVFFVEVMSGRYNISNITEKKIVEYGGSCVKKLYKRVTHVIFTFGTRVNYLKAKKLGVPILSETFVTECIKAGKIVAASQYPSINIEDYDKGKFPSLRKLKSYTIRPVEERMAIIDEKFKRKKRKEERERQKEEERKKAAKAAQRPKPVYFHPLYYEGSPYVKEQQPEDKLSKLLEEIKSPSGSPLRMDYFKAPTTPVWDDENEINLSLADRLAYRYKKNKALEKANKSVVGEANTSREIDTTLDTTQEVTTVNDTLDDTSEETPTKKILQSSSLDTTNKPRRKHKKEDTTSQASLLDQTKPSVSARGRRRQSHDASNQSTSNKQNASKTLRKSVLEASTVVENSGMDTTSRRRTGRAATAATETAYVVAATELDTTARRRSGRASTQLATKVSAILAVQETSPAKLSNSKTKFTSKSKSNDENAIKLDPKQSDEKKSVGDVEKDMKIPSFNQDSKRIKKLGRKPKNFDKELNRADSGSFGKPDMESTRLSMAVVATTSKSAVTTSKNVAVVTKNAKQVPKPIQNDEIESPVIGKTKTSKNKSQNVSTPKTNSSKTDSATKNKISPKTPQEIENDKAFDALLSSGFGAGTSGKKSPNEPDNSRIKKKFVFYSAKPVENRRRSNNTVVISPRASPRHTTCPSPSASPRQESGSSPRHHQSSSPRPHTKSSVHVEWMAARQWGSKPRQSHSAVLSASANSIYQSSLNLNKKDGNSATESQTNNAESEIDQQEQHQVPETYSPQFSESGSKTESVGKKPKVVAPWRRHLESPAQSSVSKDNVYDFEGFPDELDTSIVVSTQCSTKHSDPNFTAGKMFRVSPTKPQGAFLLRSKLSVPVQSKSNLTSPIRSSTNTTTTTINSNSTAIKSSSPSVSYISTQPANTNKIFTSGNTDSAKKHQPLSDVYSFQIDLPAVSFVENYDVNHDYHQSARSYFSSPVATEGTELSADKPPRAAKKALLSRIFSKTPPSAANKDSEEGVAKVAAKDSEEVVAKDSEEEAAVNSKEASNEDNINTGSSHDKQRSDNNDVVRSESSAVPRKRKLYSQDVLDETARNSPSNNHGIDMAPPAPVQNVHTTQKQPQNHSKSSKKNAQAETDFKKPENKTGSQKKKKKKNKDIKKDTDSDSSTKTEKRGMKASRRSSFEFQPLPKFLKKMEQKESSSSSDSSKGKRGATRNIVCTSCSQEDISLVQQLVQSFGKYTLSTSVNSRTSHVISGEGKRTLNLLKGLLSGCWLVTKEWVVGSLEAGKWVDEEPYEMVDFSPAVRSLRMERATWGQTFKSDLFKEVGVIYISPNCRAPRDELKQLVHAGGGLVTSQARISQVIVGEASSAKNASVDAVTEKWILDSVQYHLVLPFSDYPIK